MTARIPSRPRHELPAIDQAALAAARSADRLLDAARAIESRRWIAYLEPVPGHLRDDPVRDLRATARAARSAFGAKDSIAEVFPEELTRPFRDDLDRLLKVLARAEVEPD